VFQRRSIGNVGSDTQSAPTKLLDFSRGGIDLFGSPRRGNHVCSGLCETVGDGASDAGRAAYDHGHFATKLQWRIGHKGYELLAKG
jgi:hypothetical protein